MVHISTNVKGLYLSQTALKELNIIDKSFPHPPSQSCTATNEISTEEKEFPSQNTIHETHTCTHQPLQAITGSLVKVVYKEGTTLYAAHTLIIEPVTQRKCTTWYSCMIIAPKKDRKPQRTVDLQQLNKVKRRETHHTASPIDLVAAIPNYTMRTVLDAWNGYHSFPLSQESKTATTFITEWGRYHYCWAPR